MARRWWGPVCAVATGAALSLGVVQAEGEIPSFSYVRDASGEIYVVSQGVRFGIPIYPATDEQVAALPFSNLYLLPNAAGDGFATAPRPDWAVAAIAPPPPAASAPPAAPQPPPAASSSFGGVGQTTLVTGQGARFVVSVHAVTDPARSTNQFNTAKGRWVLVDYSVENIGSVEFSFSPLALKLQTADAYLIQRGNHAGLREPSLSSGDLAPGQKVRGFLAYDVPSDQRASGLIFQSGGSAQLMVARL